MRPLARALFAVISGFLIGEAQTAHPWLALVCLAPWMVAQMAPTVDAQGRAGAPLGPWGSAGLGALAYATASTYGWGIGQYGVTIFLAGMVYLSLGGALFGLLMWPLGRAPSRYVRVLGFTGAWVLVEYARTLGAASYPILVGAGLGEYPVLAQLGSVGGAWLLGAFVAALSALLAEAFEAALLREHPTLPPGRAADWLALALALLATVALGGAARLALAGPPGAVLWGPEAAAPPAPYVTVASLQGGVPTWFYRRAAAMPHMQEAIDANYFDLLDKSLEARPWGEAPRWFVLPEASLNRELPRGPAVVGAVPGLRERRFPAGATLLLGTTTGLKEADPAYPAATRENVVMTLRPDAEGRVVYQDSVGKRRLVPISEAQYRPQERWRPLEVPEARLGVMICYESLYPDITAAMPEAELWLVAANDAGLRWSQAPRIHARLGILRAIETGRGLIHASQAGYSFLVDPYGRRTAELGLFERGVVLGGVTTAHVPTLYQVLGRAWVLLAASVWALSLFLSRRMTTKSDR